MAFKRIFLDERSHKKVPGFVRLYPSIWLIAGWSRKSETHLGRRWRQWRCRHKTREQKKINLSFFGVGNNSTLLIEFVATYRFEVIYPRSRKKFSHTFYLIYRFMKTQNTQCNKFGHDSYDTSCILCVSSHGVKSAMETNLFGICHSHFDVTLSSCQIRLEFF